MFALLCGTGACAFRQLLIHSILVGTIEASSCTAVKCSLRMVYCKITELNFTLCLNTSYNYLSNPFRADFEMLLCPNPYP